MSLIIQEWVLYERLEEIIASGWLPIPNYHGYRGTGAPGQILEDLLEVDGGNMDLPDAGKWEIKYHGGSAPLTLFHKEGQPKGHMEKMVAAYGWVDDEGRHSFRHTVWGRSNRGFSVERGEGRISVRNTGQPIAELPYWLDDTLINALAQKLRRVIVVSGEKRHGEVRYNSAELFWEPRSSAFIDEIVSGTVAIDFDVRTNSHSREIDGRRVRNHGTKFRIKYENLPKIYRHRRSFN